MKVELHKNQTSIPNLSELPKSSSENTMENETRYDDRRLHTKSIGTKNITFLFTIILNIIYKKNCKYEHLISKSLNAFKHFNINIAFCHNDL